MNKKKLKYRNNDSRTTIGRKFGKFHSFSMVVNLERKYIRFCLLLIFPENYFDWSMSDFHTFLAPFFIDIN